MFGSRRATRKVCSQLAMLLESGVRLQTAVELVGYQHGRSRWSRVLSTAAQRLREGSSLSGALRPYRWAFRADDLEIIEWAEREGRLADVLVALRLIAEDMHPVLPQHAEELPRSHADADEPLRAVAGSRPARRG